jgi:hypothetical protein
MHEGALETVSDAVGANGRKEPGGNAWFFFFMQRRTATGDAETRMAVFWRMGID